MPNPVPRVRHPDWLLKRIAAKDDKTRQARISESFAAAAPAARTGSDEMEEDSEDSSTASPPAGDALADLEDMGLPRPPTTKPRPVVHQRKRAADEISEAVRRARRAAADNVLVCSRRWPAGVRSVVPSTHRRTRNPRRQSARRRRTRTPTTRRGWPTKR